MESGIKVVYICSTKLLIKYSKMKISQSAIDKITVRTKNRIALEFDCSVPTVDRWIKDNDENGDLTKAMAVQIISEETGIPVEEILEESDVKGIQDTSYLIKSQYP